MFDRFHVHLDEPDILADELPELVRRDLAQSLEPRHFGIADRLHRRVALFFAVAVARFLLVADPEQRRFQDVTHGRRPPAPRNS